MKLNTVTVLGEALGEVPSDVGSTPTTSTIKQRQPFGVVFVNFKLQIIN